VTLSFIDCINRLDLDGLCDLMTEDHELRILDEAPLAGREANRDAWRGYFEAFPNYVIYPQRIAAGGDTVAVLGTTTGSHLGLPDAEERALPVIWTATARAGRLAVWAILEDSPATRSRLGLA
jgi:ketosteroid isomerase-like protein